ncbi:MAG TPA: MoaD/ThiS family protein [Thermoplasmata archaeon]|nr:MoaD/ThiS family protein [Thermoplasmata archaeon]
MATVHLDSVLSDFVPTRTLSSTAPTLEALLGDLEARFPKLKFRIRDETGSVRRFIRVFVNGTEVVGARALSTPLGPKDTVDVLHSVQGG